MKVIQPRRFSFDYMRATFYSLNPFATGNAILCLLALPGLTLLGYPPINCLKVGIPLMLVGILQMWANWPHQEQILHWLNYEQRLREQAEKT